MIDDKHKNDILALEDIAVKQNNRINLSIILITLSIKGEELQEVIDYFIHKGIEVINEDIEPEGDSLGEDDSSIDKKVSPFDPSKIDIKMDKLTMDSLIKRIKYGELDFASAFQRKAGLWSKKQKSQLIESILLRIPLPAFYFDASDDNKWLVIDGLQRLSTIKEYVVEKSFSLTGMEFLEELNGVSYDKLPRAFQRRIEEANINAYLVNPATPKNVKFNIFKRINTGGLVLEPQEIRNALHQGKATEFIKKLAEMSCFVKATDGSVKSDRMLDREFCLRFVAFTELPLNKYTGSLDDFLNDGMEFLEEASPNKLMEIEERFEKTMNRCRELFGKNAFRKISLDGRRRPINKALFESWSYVIVSMDDAKLCALLHRKAMLVDNFIKLCDNYTFQNDLKASNRKAVLSRINEISKLVDKVILEGDRC